MLPRAATAAATSLDAVDFDQAGAGGVIFAAHDRCPVPLNEGGQNSWLAIVARRKPRSLESLPAANLSSYR